MLRDKDLVPIKVGDTILKNGCLYVITDFVDYGLQIEAVCEDKLSHEIKAFLLNDIIKIV